jgi:chemotaxis protein histidine kinase CheA
MEREEYMDVQMLCHAFVNELVTQMTYVRERYPHMERPPYEKELIDTVFEAAESMKKRGDFFPPDIISRFIHAAETVLTLMLRERLALHEPSITLLLDAAAHIKNTMGRLPSAAIP